MSKEPTGKIKPKVEENKERQINTNREKKRSKQGKTNQYKQRKEKV